MTSKIRFYFISYRKSIPKDVKMCVNVKSVTRRMPIRIFAGRTDLCAVCFHAPVQMSLVTLCKVSLSFI